MGTCQFRKDSRKKSRINLKNRELNMSEGKIHPDDHSDHSKIIVESSV